MSDRNFRRVKNIGPDLESYYRKYFQRNSSKFIWRWNLKPEALEKIWINQDCEYSLIGQVSEHTFIIKKNDDNSRWFISGSRFVKEFSVKKSD